MKPLDGNLLIRLDLLRAMVGAPVVINSGWRCEAKNFTCGGAAKSLHLYGRAADIRTAHLNELFAAAERLAALPYWKFTELIKYPERGFLHVGC
jgi:uncharacterized protein YcbK (DUF882 family)